MDIKIFPIKAGFDTLYLVQGEGVILIDGGDPHKLAQIKHGVGQASINPTEIQLIVLTHGHWDHIGSARDIQELTGAQVLMHQGDMHFLAEAHPSLPPGFSLWGRLIIAILKLYMPFVRIPAFEVGIVAGDGEISLAEYGIPGRVVPTPGHTWGSLSVLLDSGEAFVGDLAMNMAPMRLTPGLPVFGDDLQLVRHSWQKLIGMGASTVYPAHGKAFPVDIMKASL